ncbi:MAG: PAS domain-containing protein [Caldimonas sp.]
MNNPLPVPQFSVAEAARRTWPALLETMLDAVCLVEPEGLRIVAANAPAGRLLGVDPAALVGRDMQAMAATPEDACFWDEVASGAKACIVSDSYVVADSGAVIPVTRRVSRVEPAPGAALYVVALHDRSEQQRVERQAEVAAARLQATLESVNDGVLVTDDAGHISQFNRRFAAIWGVPEEMLALRADDEIFDWMRSQLSSPAVYMRRLAEIEATPLAQAVDRLTLKSGLVVEQVTTPQCSRGRPIGRVFSFRLINAGQ